MGDHPIRLRAVCMRLTRALVRALPALVCAGAIALAPSGAHAQTAADPAANEAGATSEVAIIRPLSITKLRDLDFGSIIATPAGGTVVLTPKKTATCTANGVIHVGSTCMAADFGGGGQSGRIVKVKTPSEITVTGPGAAMRIDAITLETSPDLLYVNGRPGGNGFVRYRIVSPTGVFRFRMGGTLNVNPNQVSGQYTGTFEVRIDYQ